MSKETLIKTLQDEMDYCERKRDEFDKKGEYGRSCMWNGKYSGLKLALEYVMSLDD